MPLVKLNRPYFVEYVQHRLHKENKNFLGCFVGSTGSGKSYSALSLAQQIDSNFSVDQVAFKAEDFAKLVKKDWPKGSVLVWDETGVGLSARQWQSLANKLIGLILQTFRFKNLCVLFTVPDFSFIDVQARKLLHCLFEMNGIDASRKEAIVKPLLLQVNKRTGIIYYKYLRIYREGQLIPVKRIRLPKPKDSLIAQYEPLKQAFANELYEDIVQDLEKLNKKNRPKQPLTERQKEFYTVWKRLKNTTEAAKELGVSQRYGYSLIALLRRRGYDV